MTEVFCSTIIDAPLAKVWEVIRDFNGHAHWHPAVADSHIEGGLTADTVGAVRNFHLTTGEHVREKLLSLSDANNSFSYMIETSDLPLQEYVAQVELRSVHAGDRTFWQWSSQFRVAPELERELCEIVAKNVYEAGFEAVRKIVEKPSGREVQVGSSEPLAGTAVTVSRFGDPQVLQVQECVAAPPGPNEVCLQQTAIGVNYIDIQCRTGMVASFRPPAVPGMEAAGVVVAVGENVRHLACGDRVAYACLPFGAYVTARTMDASLVFKLPDWLTEVQAAGGLLKCITVALLIQEVHPLHKGEVAVVYAPAGGVGHILCQWANHLGAHVIAVTPSAQKAELARVSGARDVIRSDVEDVVARVGECTGAVGADVIYDPVGRESFATSVKALAPGGHLVSYGQLSGALGVQDLSLLDAASAKFSRPYFFHFADTQEKIAQLTARVFGLLENGAIKVTVNTQLPLPDASKAHTLLESRSTTASMVLTAS